MIEQKEEIDQPDWMLGIAMAVLIAAMLSALAIRVLSEGTYETALDILKNTPAGAKEIALSAIYNIPGIKEAYNGTQGMIEFLLNLPLALAGITALFAYGALRWIGFGRAESAGAGLLMMLSGPVYKAFLPGFLPDAALALPLVIAGLLGIAISSKAKKEDRIGILGGSLLAFAAFCASIWLMPASALMPLGLLVGELAIAYKKEKAIYIDFYYIAKFASLALPLAVLLIRAPNIGTSNEILENLIKVPAFGWMVFGLALISIPFIMRKEAHPTAPLFACLTLAAILAAANSGAIAMAILLMPAAYGLYILGKLEREPLGWRAIAVFISMLAIIFGLLYMWESKDMLRPFGIAILGATTAVSLAHLWNWNSVLIRNWMLVFLIATSLLTSISYIQAREDWGLYPEYAPLDAIVQQELLKLGKENIGAQVEVATLAPKEAVLMLAKANAAGDKSKLMQWLASAPQTPAPYPPKTRVIIPLSIFDYISIGKMQGERNWTLVAFHYVGTVGSGNSQMAIFDSYSGLRLAHPIDSQGMGLAVARTYLYSARNNALLRVLPIGQVQLLLPEKPYDAAGQLLIWANDDLNTQLMALFAKPTPAGVKILSITEDALIAEVE